MKKLFKLGLLPMLLLSTQNLSAQCDIVSAIVEDSSQCSPSGSQHFLMAYYLDQNQRPQINGSYNYTWSNGQTGWQASAMIGQTVTVTVSNPAIAGCSAVSPAFVVQPSDAPSVTITVQQNACQGLGAIATANVSGGTPPYSFSWSNGETTQQAVALGGGFQSVSVRGLNGQCSAYESISILGIETYGTYSNDASCSISNGSAQVSVQNTNYTYLWNNGQTGRVATGLAAGVYQVTVTNPTNNCSLTLQSTVGFNPNCETVFAGNIYNSTSCTPGTSNYFNYVGVKLNNGTNYNGYWAAYNSQNNGYYELRTITPGAYTIEPFPSTYSGMSTTCPTAGQYPVTATANGGFFNGKDFSFAYPNANDVYINFWSPGVVSGFEYNQYINYCNYGQNAVANGSISISYNSNQLSYVTMNASPSWSWWNTNSNGTSTFGSNANGVLVLNYANLASGECRIINTEFLSNQTLTLGSYVTVTANISPLAGDAVPANNQYVAAHQVRSSFDPNDKQMLNYKTGNSFVGTILPTQNTMEYLIRFQNTGTAPARRVVVRDLLPSFLERNTIRNIQTSHAGQIRTEGQEMIFVFDGINLPDSFTNEAASHGFIKFTIDRVAGLPLGTQINNSASIYFDFNAPVITNTNQMTIQNLAVAVEEARKIDMRVMPNPFRDVFTVQYELETETDVRINLYNALGEAVGSFQNTQNQAAGAHQIQVPTQDLANGIYWLQIETKNGRYAQKIIKQ